MDLRPRAAVLGAAPRPRRLLGAPLVKRDRSLVILAAVAALLAALIWWDRRRPTTDEQNRERDHLVPGFARAAASEIAIERGGGGAVTRLRHEDAVVDRRPAAPSRRRRRRRVAPGRPRVRPRRAPHRQRRRRYAHQARPRHPRVTIKVANHVLRLGGDDPSRGVYVLRDGDPDALVVERRLVETAGIDPRLWISMRPTLTNPAKRDRLATGAWAIERKGGWRVAARSSRAPPTPRSMRWCSRSRAPRRPPRRLVRLQRRHASQPSTAPRRRSSAGAGRPQRRCLPAIPRHGSQPPRRPRRRPTTSAACSRCGSTTSSPPTSARCRCAARPVPGASPRRSPPPGPPATRRSAPRSSRSSPPRPQLLRRPARGAAVKLRLATSDDDVTVDLAGDHARRAGETITLDLAAAPTITLDATRLRAAGPDLGASPF